MRFLPGIYVHQVVVNANPENGLKRTLTEKKSTSAAGA
jgi:hypothetical protein